MSDEATKKAHPLNQGFVRGRMTWEEWKKEWERAWHNTCGDGAAYFDHLESLIHCGFKTEYANSYYVPGFRKELAERVRFYLQLADGWQSDCNFGDFGRSESGREQRLRLQSLAKKAFEVVSLSYLALFFEKSREKREEEIPFELEGDLLHFSRPAQWGGLENIPFANERLTTAENTAVNFLQFFIKELWKKSARRIALLNIVIKSKGIGLLLAEGSDCLKPDTNVILALRDMVMAEEITVAQYPDEKRLPASVEEAYTYSSGQQGYRAEILLLILTNYRIRISARRQKRRERRAEQLQAKAAKLLSPTGAES